MKHNESSGQLTEQRADSADASQPPAIEPRSPQVAVEDKNAACLYTNFCRVTGTPEELILDFGLNVQSLEVSAEPVEIKQRIVTSFFTAKRMLQALYLAVQRHEQAFGVLDTDVEKRVVSYSERARG